MSHQPYVCNLETRRSKFTGQSIVIWENNIEVGLNISSKLEAVTADIVHESFDVHQVLKRSQILLFLRKKEKK